MNFVFKMMDFALKMTYFVFKRMNFDNKKNIKGSVWLPLVLTATRGQLWAT